MCLEEYASRPRPGTVPASQQLDRNAVADLLQPAARAAYI